MGLDQGKGIMKITLALVDSNKNDAQKFKETGVKKMKILAAIRDVPESHSNIETSMKLTKVNNLVANYSMDNTLVNIVLGMTGALSKYPCPYAHCRKKKNGD